VNSAPVKNVARICAGESLAINCVQFGIPKAHCSRGVTPSGIEFKMIFTADGKALRVPTGNGGSRSEGSWKLDEGGTARPGRAASPTASMWNERFSLPSL
jgi:hypothetical protein